MGCSQIRASKEPLHGISMNHLVAKVIECGTAETYINQLLNVRE